MQELKFRARSLGSRPFFPLAGSYIALQFTGSTTFTGMSGVLTQRLISLDSARASAVK